MTPAIFGLAGTALSADERAFFRDAEPAGFILFARNVADRGQLRALTDELRALSGRARTAILIDQEGGPVARLRPPEWPAFPAGPAFDALYEASPMSGIEAARANGRALGAMLAQVGITVNCAPILDVGAANTTAAIGRRAYGTEPMRVAAMGRATLEGMAAAGVVGVVKHMPGHGRALVDSHLSLPVVDAGAEALARDLEPFRRLSHAAMGMTAHVVYPAWDPDAPATLSRRVITQVIRREIGFDGLLMTDDIDMKALSGTPAAKAAAAIAAGCDVVLDCWARMDEMTAIAAALPVMTPRACGRLDAAMAGAAAPPGDMAEAIAVRDALFAAAGMPF